MDSIIYIFPEREFLAEKESMEKIHDNSQVSAMCCSKVLYQNIPSHTLFTEKYDGQQFEAVEIPLSHKTKSLEMGSCWYLFCSLKR